jgi:hypothetical protein
MRDDRGDVRRDSAGGWWHPAAAFGRTGLQLWAHPTANTVWLFGKVTGGVPGSLVGLFDHDGRQGLRILMW